MTALLDVIDLHKHYGSQTALKGVSFVVNRGEIFGLLGPNGAGKTTLLSILSCLSEPSAGGVRLEGKHLRPGDRAVRHQIGIVPQELAVYEQLTARENLTFFGELYGMGGRTLTARADELLKAVGLEQRAKARVATFSGGMKRRLNLAIALVHRPRLLLLDEPTVGVDPQSRNLIFEEVRRLNREGMTVLYTSHYMEEVEELCSRIGIIDHGRLLACDTLAGLLRSLQGVIRFRVGPTDGVRSPRPGGGTADTPPDSAPAASDGLRALEERLCELAGCTFRRRGDDLELECGDVKGVLLRLIALLNECRVD